MKEFPTCRFLTTALSQSPEDTVPEDLTLQVNEIIEQARIFLLTEHYIVVYDAFDTLLTDLNEAAGRKKKGLSKRQS